jgi:eukaryotic-like serine/threonine-protein kinase
MSTLTETLSDVEQVFQAARSARERGAVVDLLAMCNGDQQLCGEVQSLLDHFEEIGDTADPNRDRRFLDPAELRAARPRTPEVSGDGLLDEWGAAALGQRVGGFALIGQIGAGAMGVVFLAEQAQPRRTVALKLLRRATATLTMIRRFEREAHLLGRLNHPGIAQVFASGVAEIMMNDGSRVRAPYIAMELVEGPNILQYVAARRHDPALALELVSQVCEAIQHAHQRGVIHRDLKPANILVSGGAHGGSPQVKVLDFGVARGAEDPLQPEAADRVTAHGQLIGTLSYMSPEQVRSSPDLDTRCDVYAIGAILYQLLCDRLPVDVRGRSLPDAARLVVEDVPDRLGTIDRALRGDVETIVAKALEKDPSRRYQTAADLVQDIRRHLAGEPIEARRDSLLYLLRKQAARYRSFSLAAAVLLLGLVAFATYVSRQQRAQAEVARLARLAQIDADAASKRATAASDRATATAAHLADELSASRLAEGRLLGTSGDLAGAERLLWDEWFAQPASIAANAALRELYWRSGCLRTISAHADECRALAMLPDGRRIATGGADALVRIWSIPDGRKLAEFEADVGNIRAVGVAPDGSRIVAAGERGAVLIDASTGARHSLLPEGVGAWGADFALNGLAAAVGSDDGIVHLFDPATAKPLLELTRSDAAKSPLRNVRIHPSCTHLAANYYDGGVMLWKIDLRAAPATASPGPAIAAHQNASGAGLGFSPDGALLGSGATDRNLHIWRVSDGSLVSTCATQNGTARSAAFSPDGRRVAVTGYWRTQIFDVQTGQPVPSNTPCLGDGGAMGAAFTPDGRLLVVTSLAGTVRIWDLAAEPTTTFPSTHSPVFDIAVARVAEQFWLASVQTDGELRIRAMQLGGDDPPGELTSRWRDVFQRNVGGHPRSLAITWDGAFVVVGSNDGHLLTVRVSDGQIVQDLPAHGAAINCVRTSPNNGVLVTAGAEGTAKVWLRDGPAGWKPAADLACGGEVIGVAVSRDGGVAVTASRYHNLAFWSLPDGKLLRHVETSSTPWKAAFSDDGRWLAVSDWERSIQIWDARPLAAPAKNADAARLVVRLMGHAQLINAESFASGADVLVSASSDNMLRIWNLTGLAPDAPAAADDQPVVDRRRCLATLDAHAGDAISVAFLPGRRGRWVAVGYMDGSVRVWDLQYYDRYMQGQIDYQRQLRRSAGR